MFVKGVGMTRFDFSQKYWWELAYEAAMEALEDAKMNISQIDIIIFSSMSSTDGSEHQTHKVSLLAEIFKTNVPIIEVPAVCAGGGVAFWVGVNFLRTKRYRNILVVGAEHLVENVSEVVVDHILSASERFLEQMEGALFPVQNALLWQRYQQKYGATMDDLALISYKNHQNAVLNEKAYFYQRPVSLEQIKKSPVVASPFRLFDCSLSVNGGAAAIISRERTDIKILGTGFATDTILPFSRKDETHFLATKIAAKEAYREAKIRLSDIDVAEIHDAFSSVELFSYEDLGFAKEGEGAKLVREGYFNLDGKVPVNPSGGLKAKGHPISATGLAQVYEIVNQLRKRCGKRQIKNPKIGLCHNIGGAGGSVTVLIFKKI